MQCENKFCIYNNKNGCILDEIELDILGCCKSCIYIKISEEELEKRKKEALHKMSDLR